MPIWKQALITLAVAAIALAAWLRFVPGAGETLARLGIDWVPFAVADTRTDDRQAASGNGGGQSGPQAGVVGSPVTRETINDRLSAIGTGRAKQSVVVTPYASGRMTEVLVESGAQIEAGQPIARLDAETEAIAVDRARVALEDAQARQTRVAALTVLEVRSAATRVCRAWASSSATRARSTAIASVSASSLAMGCPVSICAPDSTRTSVMRPDA